MIAGFVAGITSFGGNLVAVPFVTLIMDPHTAILSGCISGSAVFWGLTFAYWKNIRWRETLFLISGALCGIPPGIMFLQRAGTAAILLAAAIALLIFLGWQFSMHVLRRTQSRMASFYAFPFGFFSGIMMSGLGLGMGGPALVIYSFLRCHAKDEILSTVNAASGIMMLFILPWQYFRGLYDLQIFISGLAGGIFALFGIAISIPVLKYINGRIFKQLMLGMLLLSAIVLLLRAAS